MAVGWLWGLVIGLFTNTHEITDEEFYKDEYRNTGLEPISDDQDFVEPREASQYTNVITVPRDDDDESYYTIVDINIK